MIKVDKPQNPPAILRNRGATETLKMKDLYDASPASYKNGTKKFEFDSGIYGAKSVKKSLLKAQNNKCCFCESKITHIAYGDVEHFRPKAGYRQEHGDPLGRPGYYWAAYDWSNLYASCQICNQRFKRNLFPLSNPTERAFDHHESIEQEVPVLIDPGKIDPENHIAFREEIAFPINDSDPGKETIRNIGINRDELSEVRRDYLEKMKVLAKVARNNPNLPERDEINKCLEKAMSKKSQYSSMIRALVSSI